MVLRYTRVALFIAMMGLLVNSVNSFADEDVDWSMPLVVEGIFVLDNTEIDVLDQCARESVEAKLAWRPTFEQVKIVDGRLRAMLKKTKSKFKVLPKEMFHRQYIGYTDEQGEWIYVNIYPAKDEFAKIESRHGISSCDKSRLYWGISFSIETFEFGEIMFNNKTVIPLQEPGR